MTMLAVWASFGPAYGLYRLLMVTVPGMNYLRAPSRIGVDVALGLAVLAGFGARWLISRWRPLAAILLVLAVADRYAEWPLGTETIPNVYRMLATLPRGVVVDFPFPYLQGDWHQHTRPMYYSTADWMPRVNGYSDILPSDFLEVAEPINDFPLLSAFPLMHQYNVRYVVWRLADYGRDPTVIARLASRFGPASPYLRVIYRDEQAWLYEIVRWPETK
jgi:hypothetical protein